MSFKGIPIFRAQVEFWMWQILRLRIFPNRRAVPHWVRPRERGKAIRVWHETSQQCPTRLRRRTGLRVHHPRKCRLSDFRRRPRAPHSGDPRDCTPGIGQSGGKGKARRIYPDAGSIFGPTRARRAPAGIGGLLTYSARERFIFEDGGRDERTKKGNFVSYSRTRREGDLDVTTEVVCIVSDCFFSQRDSSLFSGSFQARFAFSPVRDTNPACPISALRFHLPPQK